MHDPPCSSVEAFQHSKCHARQAVFSFKLKISNPVRVDIWFREFDDIVFDLRLTGLMTESQPTLDLIQSHFSELADSEQQQLLQNALAHWYDEEARLYLQKGVQCSGEMGLRFKCVGCSTLGLLPCK